MMNRMLVILAAVLLATAARAEYVLWFVDQKSQPDPIDFTYAKLAVSGEGVESGTYLALDGTDGWTEVYHSDYPDTISGYSTDEAYSILGAYAADGYSFAVELYRENANGESMLVGVSDPVSYAILKGQFHTYENIGQSGIVPYAYSAFGAVPEPTCGTLLLFGAGLLALRRRRFVNICQ